MKQPGPIAWLEGCSEPMLTPLSRREVSYEQALATLSEHPAQALPPAKLDMPGGWLEGVKILDLTNVIAGPHSTSFLGRFGADVIKLDPVVPNYDPWNTVVFGMSSARGKESVLIDLNKSEGRDVFNRLVREVDVIVMNAPDRQLAPLGLDEASLQAVNPGVIFCQLDCFGGPRRGPRTDYLGYDDLIQATTGIMLRFGGGMETPEEHAHVGTIDVMCGFAAALGVATALYRKHRCGEVYRARTSLASLGIWYRSRSATTTQAEGHSMSLPGAMPLATAIFPGSTRRRMVGSTWMPPSPSCTSSQPSGNSPGWRLHLIVLPICKPSLAA